MRITAVRCSRVSRPLPHAVWFRVLNANPILEENVVRFPMLWNNIDNEIANIIEPSITICKGGVIDHRGMRSELARSRLSLRGDLHQMAGATLSARSLRPLRPCRIGASTWGRRFLEAAVLGLDLTIPWTTHAILTATAT